MNAMYSDASSHGPHGSPHGGRFPDDGPGASSPSEPRPGAALKDALGHIGELKEYASYYVAAKLDGYKVMATNLGIYAVLGVVGAVAGCTVVSMAVVLLVGGVAWALGALFAHWFGAGWFWLGPLLVGLLILGGLAGGVVFGLKWLTRTSHARLIAKYKDRQRQQRIDYGHDVEQRASEQRAGTFGPHQ